MSNNNKKSNMIVQSLRYLNVRNKTPQKKHKTLMSNMKHEHTCNKRIISLCVAAALAMNGCNPRSD